MIPPKAISLPPISLLPLADPCFTQAARDVALIASGLIASIDAALLTIVTPSERCAEDVRIIAWSQRLTASPALARTLIETPIFSPAFDALTIAANALFRRLETWRWREIDVPGLCLVTDGVGVLVSTARPPADARCAWLLDLARPESGAETALPLSPNGAWSLIATQSATLQ